MPAAKNARLTWSAGRYRRTCTLEPSYGGETPLLAVLASGKRLLVPLAIPMVTGPSAIAIQLIISNDQPDRMMDWTIAVVIAWLGTTIILAPAACLKKMLGKCGLIAAERLMGMLLLAIAVQMFLEGIAGSLKSSGVY